MAKAKEIYCEASFTKNLGNYQSVKISAGVKLELSDKDEVRKVYEEGWDLVGDQVSQQLALFEEEQRATKVKGLK